MSKMGTFVRVVKYTFNLVLSRFQRNLCINSGIRGNKTDLHNNFRHIVLVSFGFKTIIKTKQNSLRSLFSIFLLASSK